MPHRPSAFHHATSQALHFFGRHDELALLDRALRRDGLSVVALVGPGGQGKTAIVQHWLGGLRERVEPTGIEPVTSALRTLRSPS